MDWDRYVDAASEMMDLPVELAWRSGVVQFLEIAAEMAAVLDRVDLADDKLELAPVYTPPGGGDG